jgi:AcrR family transcriptional regulator
MGRRPFVRQQILEAAFDLVARRGYEAVSTRDIALAAGVGPASMFRHFATKEDLGRALYRVALAPVAAAAEAALATPGPASNAVAALMAELCRLYDERPRALALLIFPPHDFTPEEVAPGSPHTIRGRLQTRCGLDDDAAAVLWGAMVGPLADRYLRGRQGTMAEQAPALSKRILRLLTEADAAVPSPNPSPAPGPKGQPS